MSRIIYMKSLEVDSKLVYTFIIDYNVFKIYDINK